MTTSGNSRLSRTKVRVHMSRGRSAPRWPRGVRSRSSMIQNSPASWSQSMVRSRCRQTVQATTEASEADQAGLSCRARQTWWITLIVGPYGPSSGQVSGWGGSGPRQIPSEMPAGRRTGSRRARAAGDSENDSAGVSVTLLV